MLFAAVGQTITMAILAAMIADGSSKAKGYVAAALLFVSDLRVIGRHFLTRLRSSTVSSLSGSAASLSCCPWSSPRSPRVPRASLLPPLASGLAVSHRGVLSFRISLLTVCRLLCRDDLARAHCAHQVGHLCALDRHQPRLHPAHLLLQCVTFVTVPVHADRSQSPKPSMPLSKTSTPSSRRPPHGSWVPVPAGVWPRSWLRARRRRPCTWRWRRAVAKTRRTSRQSRRGTERNALRSGIWGAHRSRGVARRRVHTRVTSHGIVRGRWRRQVASI